MPSTAIVWFRRDLRLHDHPPLVRALAEHDHVVPVFVFDRRLIGGRFPSPGRTQFLLDSLRELSAALEERGAQLIVREGLPHEEIAKLAGEVAADAVYFASDVSPYARARDQVARAALEQAGVRAVFTPGNFCADFGKLATKDGRPYTVFSPFYRSWDVAPRRTVHRAPPEIPGPPSAVPTGALPALRDFGLEPDPRLVDPIPAGEAEARDRLSAFLGGPLDLYAERHDRLAGGTSVLSPHIHFGNVSVREIEERVLRHDGEGPDAFRRQLAWRDFYGSVLWHFPDNAFEPFQERYASLEAPGEEEHLGAWKEGVTGYPLVDAGMRQLRATGWMHNRARLVTGSFLVKDLHVDWRHGEAHFMRHLLCGDEAQNNGNWQWVASVGVDPAPVFRRMFNPTRQWERFDDEGEYVRRWVPELARVPLERLGEPWTMSDAEQEACGCVIGRDYPGPIVDHADERKRALALYGAARE
ncbi:MAG: cryptochrome/photolyase family protein [Solirubrobacteraceae bacterium]